MTIRKSVAECTLIIALFGLLATGCGLEQSENRASELTAYPGAPSPAVMNKYAPEYFFLQCSESSRSCYESCASSRKPGSKPLAVKVDHNVSACMSMQESASFLCYCNKE